MAKILIGLVLGVLVFASVSCSKPSNPADLANVVKPGVNVGGVVDYGNGVYYFDKVKSDFANALSAFLASHDCKIEGITGDGNASYGRDDGYFVVCR